MSHPPDEFNQITDPSTLQKRIKSILSIPGVKIWYTNFADYNPNGTHKFSSIAKYTAGIPLRNDLGLQGFDPQKDFYFAFARHVTFDNMYDCHPNKQKLQKQNNMYTLSNKYTTCPHYYTLPYFTEYGKKSSFWNIGHVKHVITNKYLAHAVAMSVMMDMKKRKPKPVGTKMKTLIDYYYNNIYPKTLKPKYRNLKNILLNDMNLLNNLKKLNNKQLLYSHPLQLRYDDEDNNNHLNLFSYPKYVNEGLVMFDKDLITNKAIIYCMSNIYWKEIRMKFWNHCYVNIWSVKDRELNGKCMKLIVGTIDIDEKYSKRYDNKVSILSGNDSNQFVHYHGFVAGIVSVDTIESKL
eukprot:85305_1